MIESKGTQKHNERQNNTKKNEKSCVNKCKATRIKTENKMKTLSYTVELLQIAQTKNAPMQSYPSKHMQ